MTMLAVPRFSYLTAWAALPATQRRQRGKTKADANPDGRCRPLGPVAEMAHPTTERQWNLNTAAAHSPLSHFIPCFILSSLELQKLYCCSSSTLPLTVDG